MEQIVVVSQILLVCKGQQSKGALVHQEQADVS